MSRLTNVPGIPPPPPPVAGNTLPSNGKKGLLVCSQFFTSHGRNGSTAATTKKHKAKMFFVPRKGSRASRNASRDDVRTNATRPLGLVLAANPADAAVRISQRNEFFSSRQRKRHSS